MRDLRSELQQTTGGRRNKMDGKSDEPRYDVATGGAIVWCKSGGEN